MTIEDTAPAAPEVSTCRLDLTRAEQTELRALAEQLVRTPPGLLDDPRWLTRARHLTCHLPRRLSEAIRSFRHDPDDGGALLVSGLPVDPEALPETPRLPESVDRTASPHSAASVLIGLHLGELVSYRQEKGGALVQNVVPVPGLERSQSNAGSAPLEFHVENVFHPCRPDYVGLTCLRPDHEQNAGTLVSSIRHVLPHMSETDQKVLHQARFVTSPPPSFRTGAPTPAHPVLVGSWDDPDVRLDFNATKALDDEARQVLERMRAVVAETALSVRLNTGEMVIVDNRLLMHGRAPFVPRYDGRDRWLQRIFVHLDNRRTREHRAGNGAVID